MDQKYDSEMSSEAKGIADHIGGRSNVAIMSKRLAKQISSGI